MSFSGIKFSGEWRYRHLCIFANFIKISSLAFSLEIHTFSHKFCAQVTPKRIFQTRVKYKVLYDHNTFHKIQGEGEKGKMVYNNFHEIIFELFLRDDFWSPFPHYKPMSTKFYCN